MKDLWKYFARLAVPMIESAGEMYVNQDENETGKDDLIGKTLIYIASLIKAVLSGDTNKIQSALDKTSVSL